MESMRLNGGRKYLKTSDWDSGIYFVVINGAETRRLIVQHE